MAQLAEPTIAAPIMTDTPERQLPTPTPTAVATVAAPDPATHVATDTSTAQPTDTSVPTQTVSTPTDTPGPTGTGAVPTETPTSVSTTIPAATTTETIIDASGGQVTSIDGHVTLDFPPGATKSSLRISVANKTRSDTPAMVVGTRLLTAWQFDAADINNGEAPVHQFASNFTVHLHYSSAELFGLREDLIRYWVFDDIAGTWSEQTVSPVEGKPYDWNVQLNHFSTQASSSDGVLNLPPILDAAQVNTNTGASTFSLPIPAPAGPGGLEPHLALTYNSERADENTGTTPASWAGIGWDLSTPSITRSGLRYFLNTAGAGSELLQAADYTTSHKWVTRNQQFLDIVHDAACDDLEAAGESLSTSCQWTIRDQSGRTSVFGADSNPASRRYYFAPTSCALTGYNRYYQWDLASVTDLHGNAATYQYQQILGWETSCIQPSTQTVVSSYPTTVTYPGGSVTFTQSANLVPSATIEGNAPGPFVMMRPDAAAFTCSVYLCQFTPVLETRALASVAWSGAAGAGSYNLHVDTFGTETRLISIDVNPIGFGALYSIGFAYQAGGTSITSWAGSSCANSGAAGGGSLLASVSNGFGGSVGFAYTNRVPMTQATCGHINRWLVNTRTASGGFSAATNPLIATTYSFTGDPVYETDGAYRGFGTSTETDAASNVVTRTYLTIGELAGRLSAESVSGGGATPKSVLYAWSSTNQGTGVYFNHLDTTTSTLYGLQTTVNYQYATTTHGAVTKKIESATGVCRVTTTDYYYQPPAGGGAYLLLPKTTQSVSGAAECGGGSPIVEAQTTYYYDGTVSGALTKGNLTATRRMADKSLVDGDSKKYVWTLASYYGNGLPYQVSVPMYGDQNLPLSSNVNGAIVSTRGHTDLTYDSANSPLPASQTVYVFNPDGTAASPATRLTTYTYDALHRAAGKPWKTTSPSFMEAGVDYDNFGRPVSAWQSPDNESSPDTTSTYAWNGPAAGGVNYTTTTSVGGAVTVDCLDGLGRTTQTNSKQSSFALTAWQRTQVVYDQRGLRTNTRVFRDVQSCNPSVTGQGQSPSAPNQLVVHDALGNVTTTTINDGASPVPGNVSVVSVTHPAVIAGRVTTRTIDQLGHQKEVDADGPGRTVESREYTGIGAPYALYSRTTYQYDILDRLTQVTDNAGNITLMTYDALGRKKSMIDPDMSGGNTAWLYEYDAAGNLSKQTDARRVVTTMTYDSLNRLRSKHYDISLAQAFPTAIPPQADVVFTYDAYDSDSNCAGQAATAAIGKMTVMTDASGSTRWCYDIRGREIRKRRRIVGDAVAYDVAHAYDSASRVTSLTYPGGEAVTAIYDNVLQGAAGHLFALQSSLTGDIISSTVYAHPNGALTSLMLGNGAVTTYGYDALYRLGSISTALGSATVQGLSYTYLANGGLQTTNDTIAGENITYSYDDLDRLTGMQSASGTLATYAYAGTPGSIGDLTRKKEGAADITLTYPASGSTPQQPHAVSKISGTQARTFTLDKDGNQIGSANDAYDFDVENRLVAIHGAKPDGGTGSQCMDMDDDGVISILDIAAIGDAYNTHRGDATFDFRADLDWDDTITILDLALESSFNNQRCPAQRTTYLYDGLGNLVKRTNTSTSPSTSSWTEYIDGLYEKTNTGAITKYYQAFGRPVAMQYVSTGTGAGTVTYLLADRLGSTVGAIDATTGGVSTQKYYPFGAPRAGAIAQTDRAYTGQQKQPLTSTGTPLQGATDALGTYNYKARFYGTVTGRFLSADASTLDGLNRFSYVRNSPTNYNDPSGHGKVGIPGPGCSEGSSGDHSCDPDRRPPCDITCARGVEKICAANPGAPGCGDAPGPTPTPVPTSTSTSVPTVTDTPTMTPTEDPVDAACDNVPGLGFFCKIYTHSCDYGACDNPCEPHLCPEPGDPEFP